MRLQRSVTGKTYSNVGELGRGCLRQGMTGRVPSSLILHQSTIPKGRSSLLPFLATPTNTQKTPNKQGLCDFLPRIKPSLEWDGVDGCDPVTPPRHTPFFSVARCKGEVFMTGKKGFFIITSPSSARPTLSWGGLKASAASYATTACPAPGRRRIPCPCRSGR